jgi:hypothetical protein
MSSEQAPGFGRADGAGVPVEQLLAEGLFHQLDLPGDGRGRQALSARHFGKAAQVQYGDE